MCKALSILARDSHSKIYKVGAGLGGGGGGGGAGLHYQSFCDHSRNFAQVKF